MTKLGCCGYFIHGWRDTNTNEVECEFLNLRIGFPH